MFDQLILSGIVFGRNAIGLVGKPYETYRRIIDKGSAWELVFIAALVTVSAFRLVAAAVVTYALVVSAVWVVGRHLGGKGTMRGVALGWGYTMLPTVCWFFMTSLLYIVLPPPRTTSFAGIAFSVLFLVVSATLFFWKLTLGYLTLRFGLKLDLARILVVSAVVSPVIAAWSLGMYRLGIFKVPFI